MKILILIGLSLISASCGLEKKFIKKINIHPQAQPYVAKFESTQGGKIDDLEVTFRAFESGTNVLAYCQRSTKSVQKNLQEIVYATPLIVINSNYWDNKKATQEDKELLLFHELGHCILDRMHTDSRVDGRPASVMNTYHIGGLLYSSYYGSYQSELFHNNKLALAAFASYPMASRFPEFKEPEIEVLSEHEIKDCVNEKEHEVVKLKDGEELSDYLVNEHDHT